MNNAFINKWCRKVEIKPEDPIMSTRTRGLKTTVVDVPASKLRFTYESIDVDGLISQRELNVMLRKMRKTSFDWLVPLHSDPQGSAEVDPLVKSDVAAGQTLVDVVRSDNGQTFLEIGDWVQFDNHSKVYTVASQASGTDPTIELLEPLEYPITTATIMKTRNVMVKVMQDPSTDPVVYNREAGDLDSSFSIELIEL